MDILIAVVVALFFYFLPAIVAAGRGHHNAVAILLLNLFLGWTFLGWVVALVWSATSSAGQAAAPSPGIAAPAGATVNLVQDASDLFEWLARVVPTRRFAYLVGGVLLVAFVVTWLGFFFARNL